MLVPKTCREKRIDAGWSIGELANEAGVASGLIDKFENGDEKALSDRGKIAVLTAFERRGADISTPAPKPKPDLQPDICRAWRRLNKWSTADLARKAGYSATVIGDFEAKRAGLKDDALAALEKALGSQGYAKPTSPVAMSEDWSLWAWIIGGAVFWLLVFGAIFAIGR
jgi:ribosome-binding protein aMBF1 (putative translation factor)